MSLAFRLIKAAHCHGTHHYLAVDTLDLLAIENKRDWQHLFYHHIEAYLQGSKAPDKVFKDYKNHVLHVRDGYWGGAADACEEWYTRLVHNLKTRQWRDAVYAAGVLSHYYADALHPFHTAQSEAESNIHRATEWSISKSYAKLKNIGSTHFAELDFDMPKGEGWLKSLVEQNAGLANQYYEGLIAHYNFDRGVVDPEEGLDLHAREMVSWIIRYTTVSFARVLNRAFRESGMQPQKHNLTVEAFLAGLTIPLFWVTKNMADTKERQLVEAIYDELHSTGTVEVNLPTDDKAVRELYEKEVLTNSSHWDRVRETAQHVSLAKPEVYDTSGHKIDISAVKKHARPKRAKQSRRAKQSGRSQRFYLELTAPVIDAPYIGRKTAKRMEVLGIETVGDFLKFTPEQILRATKLRDVTEDDIASWQAQSQLMCDVPGVKAAHAKSLAAANIISKEQLADAKLDELSSLIDSFNQREKSNLTSEMLEEWIQAAKSDNANASVTDKAA